MTMPEPTEETLERFRALVPDGAGVEVRPMSGRLGAALAHIAALAPKKAKGAAKTS